MTEIKTGSHLSAKNRIWPWLIVAGFGIMNACTMQLIMSNSGIFMAPICDEFGFSRGNFALWVTCLTLALAATMPFMGRLLQRFDVRLLLTGAFLVCIGSWACNSLWSEIWQWCVCAVITGMGGAFVFAQAMPIITGNWFAKNKGLIIGCTYMVSAGIAAALAPIGAMVIQAFGWRSTYLILAAVSAVCVLPFTIFVFRFKPEDMGMKPFWYDPNSTETTAVGDATTPGLMCNKAMKTVSFWLLFIVGGLVTLFGGFTKQVAPAALTWGYDAMFGAYLTSLIALYRFASPIAGFLADKFGAVKVMILWLCVVACGFLGFIFFNGNPTLVIVATVCLAFQSSMQNTFIPTVTRQIFGSKDYSKIFSSIATGFSLIGAFGTPIVGWFYDLSGGVYTNAFWFGTCICIAAGILVVAAEVLGKKVTWDE